MPMRMTPAHIRSTLHLSLKEMENDIGSFVKRPGRDFSRRRIGTFSDTIRSIMTMEAHSLNRELFEFYCHLKKEPLTKSAFIQNRAKLNSSAFPHLLKHFNSKIPFRKQYKGLHLIACDGTDSNIPADEEDTLSFIPFNSNNGGYYQFHTTVMFDLLEKRYVDAVIQPRRELHETDACCAMVDRNLFPDYCLFIADRGFLSYNVLAHIAESHHYFLIRAKNIDEARSPFRSCRLPSDDDCEISCEFVLSRKRNTLQKRFPDKYKWLHPLRRFDFIPPGDKTSTYTLFFRLVKLRLPDGSYEFLVSNLPKNTFSLDDLRFLYGMRWGVETSFRFLKFNLALNYFHSIKREFLIQEIFAKLILYNLISLIVSCAGSPNNNARFSCCISFSDAIYKCRSFLLGRISGAKLLVSLNRGITPVRPGRSFERKMRSQCLKSLQNRT